MKTFRRVFIVVSTLILSFAIVPVAWAHPLGNFTINHYAGLHVTPNSIAIDFVMDMAEIPAFQEITAFDANGNGQPDVSEANAYHAITVPRATHILVQKIKVSRRIPANKINASIETAQKGKVWCLDVNAIPHNNILIPMFTIECFSIAPQKT